MVSRSRGTTTQSELALDVIRIGAFRHTCAISCFRVILLITLLVSGPTNVTCDPIVWQQCLIRDCGAGEAPIGSAILQRQDTPKDKAVKIESVCNPSQCFANPALWVGRCATFAGCFAGFLFSEACYYDRQHALSEAQFYYFRRYDPRGTTGRGGCWHPQLGHNPGVVPARHGTGRHSSGFTAWPSAPPPPNSDARNKIIHMMTSYGGSTLHSARACGWARARH